MPGFVNPFADFFFFGFLCSCQHYAIRRRNAGLFSGIVYNMLFSKGFIPVLYGVFYRVEAGRISAPAETTALLSEGSYNSFDLYITYYGVIILYNMQYLNNILIANSAF